jgi:hypothetical protein
MLMRFCTLLAMAGALQAQQVVAPTPDQVGSPRGTDTGDYNITQSFEVGYRWSAVGGDLGAYRTDVNYGNGIRLLGSSFAMESKDGHGHYFDEIMLNTTGLGNDPYESVALRVQKNRLYRYDMTWRLNDYYNPGLTVAGGLHLMDTSRHLQDHDITLLPQSRVQFRLGYSRSTESGPALSTAQEFDSNGTAYPVFTDVRRQWNEYRIGADVQFLGFKLTLLRRWDFYKDDTPAGSVGVVASGVPNDQSIVQQFNRSQPVHGSNPAWLGNLFTRRKYWGINARMTYVSGTNNFALDEFATGIGQFGSPAARQIAVGGSGKQPDLAGNFAINLFPTEQLTVTNNTSVTSNRIDGQSTYSEVLNALNLGTTINFRYLGILLVTNSTDINYRAAKWFGVYGGYHYSDRRLSTIEGFNVPAFAGDAGSASYQVSNLLQSGTLGVRIRPVKPLTINLEGEVGRANQPLTPISPANFHTLGGRIDYRLKNVQLSASYREVYDVNSPQLFSLYNSHSRNYNANASWAPKSWFTLDASYSQIHLDSQSFLAFFAGVNRPQLQTGYQSLYISNIHSGNLGIRFALGKRADVYVGYSITMDTGDGRAAAVPPDVTDPIQALLSSVETFPLTYQSPLGRVSIKILPKVRWNAGFQLYNYNEKFNLLGYYQNFHAVTGYTSVLWSF